MAKVTDRKPSVPVVLHEVKSRVFKRHNVMLHIIHRP
jgi:hypothetical protein